MAKILVVDDVANNRLLISTVLGHAGHAVSEAADAKAAFEEIAKSVPDLVLVDLNLPDTSGPAFIKQLRADERTRDTRIALYTASVEDRLLQDFMDMLDIRVSVPKPADPQTIIARVNEALL